MNSTFRTHPSRCRSRGFTLVELLIVGALIALFAGIALFGVQQQYLSNQRKAIIGETRQVAAALDFAYNDLGFFPHIGMLSESVDGLRLEGQRQFGNPDRIFASLSANFIATPGRTNTIQSEWLGPYFSAAGARSQIAQGRGGARQMQVFLPDGLDTGGVGTFRWPVDTFNNPYMLYMLNYDLNGAGLHFAVNSVDDPNERETRLGATGTAFTAVVSYGRNRVPGGGELTIPDGDQTSPATTSPYGLRLYVGNPDNTDDPLTLIPRTGMRSTNLDGRRRANVWGAQFAQEAGLGTGWFALSDDNEPIGITDVGSDDIVFTF